MSRIRPQFALHQEWYKDDDEICEELGLKASDIYEDYLDEDYLD